uniref:Uncharacterized protein n=1 Tax=Anguilla anguilla TaxID=7936 RepID=A0A0E9REL8_ANGAN
MPCAPSQLKYSICSTLHKPPNSKTLPCLLTLLTLRALD